MVKTIIMRHVELMAVCQSHSFEIFVSLANLMRFYSYIVANVFIGRNKYKNLVQDPEPSSEVLDPNQKGDGLISFKDTPKANQEKGQPKKPRLV